MRSILLVFCLLFGLSKNIYSQCTLAQPGNITTCNGASVSPPAFSASAGTTVKWTNSNPAIGLPASGVGNLPVFTAVNSGSSATTATITVQLVEDAFAYIPNSDNGTVSVIDLSTNTVIDTIAVGNLPVGITVSSDGTKVYVVNTGDNSVSVISTATNTVTATVTVGPFPVAAAVTPDGAKLYVANGGDYTVSVVNTSTNSVTATIGVGVFHAPVSLAASPNGAKVYVVSEMTGSVEIIDVATNNINTGFLVGTGPRDVAFSPDGSRAYVVNAGSENVSVINTATNAVISTIAIPGTYLMNVCVSPDGSRVFVVDGQNSKVYAINTANNTVIGSANIGSGNEPVGIDISPDGQWLYALNTGTGTVSVINASNYSIPTTITVGGIPNAIGKFITGTFCATKTFTITVNPSPSATIDYFDVTYCASGTALPTHTGTTGGTYSSTTGLVINSTTGEINLASSTPGTYTVTYTIPASGGCAQVQATASVEVLALPTVTASSNSPVTTGGTITLTASGATNYSWSGPNSYSATGSPVSITNAQPVNAGTYTVTGTDANGCTNTATTSVAVNAAAASISTSALSASSYCAGASVSVPYTITGSFTSGNVFTAQLSNASGSFASPVNIGTATSTTSGTISATIPSGTGAGSGYRVRVVSSTPAITGSDNGSDFTVNPLPSATISYASSPYCSNGGTATVTQTGTSGGTYSSTAGLVINSTTGAINLASSTPGTYTVTYTIAASGGCAAFSTTATVTITAAPTAGISYAGTPYCANAGTAAVTQTGTSGGTYSSTAGLVINSTTGAITLGSSTPGTYTVTYTIAASGGCAAFSTTATVTITAAPSATISYSGSPYCANAGTAAVTQTGTSGSTYSSTAGLVINSTTGAITLGSSTPGTYTVTYTIAASGGCAAFSTTTTVTITAAPTASISYAGTPYCANAGTAAVTQTGTSGGTYSSTTGLVINGTTGAITLGSSTPGTYTVTYTIAASGGCASFSTTATVTITAAPSATISYSASPYCANAGTAAVTQTGTSGGTYSSTTGLVIDATTGTITLGTSTPGTYTVTYTIAASGGCAQATAQTSVTITALPAATISYSGSPYCASGSATVTRTGTSGGTYSSTTGLVINSTTGAITLGSSTPGTYTVTYTIAASGGCGQLQATASVEVLAQPAVTASSNSPVTTGGTITLTASGATNYSWSGPNSYSATGSPVSITNAQPVNAGTYTVTGTDANGCTNTAAITVVVNPPAISTSALSASSYCAGEPVSVPYTITGSYTSGNVFTAQLSNASGSFASPVNIGTVTSTTSGTISATIPSGTAGGSGYRIRVVSSMPAITGSDNGSNLTIYARPTVNAIGNQVVCANGATTAITFAGTATSYNWTNNTPSIGLSASGGGNIPSFTALNSSLAPVSAVISVTPAANGCSGNILSFTITVNPTPSLVSNLTQPPCYNVCNGSIALTVSGGTAPYQYTWTNSTATTPAISNLCPNTYAVTVKDANNCTVNSTFLLVNPVAYTMNLGGNRLLCAGQSTTLDATLTTPATYQWKGPNNFTGTTAIIVATDPGTYVAKATTALGCVITDSVVITRKPIEIASEFLVTTQAFKNSSVKLVNISAPKFDTVLWKFPADPNVQVLTNSIAFSELFFKDTGTYHVTLEARREDCIDTTTKRIIVLERGSYDSLANVLDPMVLEFKVYPIPNNGNFSVKVALKQKGSIRLRLVNLVTSQVVEDRQLTGNCCYLVSYNNIPAGVYVLVLEAPNKATYIHKVLIN